ncbi:hypothetical protein [Priestia megaterium]|uniref:hypothetical protein n=1 Tax=Priestia megaterium TaxID=1404 RepID=UPI00203B4EA9|nr:hypothetical protein [Priestia megaterium]MCM3197166.1 hypothetical protein [Priestia megaterium]
MTLPAENSSQNQKEKLLNGQSALAFSVLNQVTLAFIKANEEIKKYEQRENADLQIAKDFLQMAQETAQQAVLKGLNNDLYK